MAFQDTKNLAIQYGLLPYDLSTYARAKEYKGIEDLLIEEYSYMVDRFVSNGSLYRAPYIYMPITRGKRGVRQHVTILDMLRIRVALGHLTEGTANYFVRNHMRPDLGFMLRRPGSLCNEIINGSMGLMDLDSESLDEAMRGVSIKQKYPLIAKAIMREMYMAYWEER